MRHEIAWLPTFGLSLTLRLDGFAWLFMMLITSIGLLVVLYARYYLSPKDPAARFFSLPARLHGGDGRGRAARATSSCWSSSGR